MSPPQNKEQEKRDQGDSRGSPGDGGHQNLPGISQQSPGRQNETPPATRGRDRGQEGRQDGEADRRQRRAAMDDLDLVDEKDLPAGTAGCVTPRHEAAKEGQDSADLTSSAR